MRRETMRDEGCKVHVVHRDSEALVHRLSSIMHHASSLLRPSSLVYFALSLLFLCALHSALCAPAFAGALHVPATTADLPDSADKRYVTDTQKNAIDSMQSYTPETTDTIKTKLGAATNNADGYMTAADRAMFHGGLLARWAELGGALPITSCPPTQQILDTAAAMGFDQNHIFCVVFPVGGLITGTPSSYFLGSLTASGGGTAAPTGSALTQVLGSLTALAYSNWYATPSGIGSQYVIGGLAGHGNGTATLIGFAQTGQLGTVIGSSTSSGNVAIFGVEQNIVLGSLVGHGDGNRTLTGIAQGEVMGSLTALAYSIWYATPSGIGPQITLGSLVGHGAGNRTLTGITQSEVIGSVTGSTGGGGTNYIGNFGFESALSGSETTENWFPVIENRDATSTVIADAYSSGTMSGSKVGRLSASYLSDGYCSVPERTNQPDCESDSGTWYSYEAPWGALVQDISGDNLRAGTGTLSLYARLIEYSTVSMVTLNVLAYDAGNSIISSTTEFAHVITIVNFGGYSFGSGQEANNSLIKITSPSTNQNYLLSFDLKTWLVGKLNSGKTISDISKVQVSLAIQEGQLLGTTQMYFDEVKYQ